VRFLGRFRGTSPFEEPRRCMVKGFFIRKPLNAKSAELEESPKGGLRRHLGSLQLVTIGIGAIIGAGIFVITGQAAAEFAGPAVVLSFLVAFLVCLFAGLCYAELSAMIPVAGGSYSYAYAAMGEFPAWIVGWALTAQYLISLSTVSVGWGGYFTSLMRDFGIQMGSSWTQAPIAYSAAQGWGWSGAFFNLPAACLVAFVGILISVGIRAATHFNNVMVVIKLSTIVLFILLGIPHIHPENWTPFIPENGGLFGQFGWSGILRASGLVFFAYIGFDTVATLAQEAKRPQKDLPIGILGSLGICTLAYILTSLILTGVASYTLLGVPDPMTVALDSMGPSFFWLAFIVKIAILAGLASVVLVQSMGQTRIFYAISKDGLLPSAFSKLDSKHTPLFATFMTALVSLLLAGLLPISVLGELVSVTTLFIFAIVCLGVWILRIRHPEFERPFKVPFVPWVPLAGMIACLLQMSFMPAITWAQLAIWLLFGLIVYFTYSFRRSVLRKNS
jgi:APA family basic amino acid/polyamine antiporter